MPRNFSTPVGRQILEKGSLQTSPTYIPCQWSLWRHVCLHKEHPDPNRVHLQLATGKVPFHEFPEQITAAIAVLRGKRPRKPRPFGAKGITKEVWKVAEKCWHQKAEKRPEVKQVLQILHEMENPGVCISRVPTGLLRKFADFRLEQVMIVPNLRSRKCCTRSFVEPKGEAAYCGIHYTPWNTFGSLIVYSWHHAMIDSTIGAMSGRENNRLIRFPREAH